MEGGKCIEHNIPVFPSGFIQGQIRDSANRVLPYARVYILPAGKNLPRDENQLYSVGQGKQGYFKFLYLPPGRYTILVNPSDKARPDFPYSRTYYPGVRDQASAGIITLKEGEQIKGIDVRLK